MLSTALAMLLAAASPGWPSTVRSGCEQAPPTDGSYLPSTVSTLRLAKDWIDRINSADDAAYVRFVAERGPVLLDGPERWLQLRDNLRGVQLCGVKSADATSVELWAFDPSYDAY